MIAHLRDRYRDIIHPLDRLEIAFPRANVRIEYVDRGNEGKKGAFRVHPRLPVLQIWPDSSSSTRMFTYGVFASGIVKCIEIAHALVGSQFNDMCTPDEEHKSIYPDTLVSLNSTFGVFHFGPIGTSDLSEYRR